MYPYLLVAIGGALGSVLRYGTGIAVGRVAQRRVRALAWLLFAVLSMAALNILFTMRFAQ